MKIKYFLSVAALFFIFSCGNSDQSSNTTDSSQVKVDSPSAVKDTVAPASVTQQDKNFATDAANIGMMEITLGKVAQQNAMRKDVKDFGAMMVKDHSAAADDLKKIADNKHLSLPTSLSADDQKKVDDMKAKTGNDFDKAYINMMIEGHKKAADKFQDEIKQGSDADLRSFATKTLDVIHAHLEAAQKCKAMQKG